MSWTAMWLAAGLLAGPGDTQEASPPAAAQQQAPEARLEVLEQEFEDAQQAFFAAYKAAQTDEERDEALKKQPDAAAFAQKYRALAMDAAGTPVAVKAWSKALDMAGAARDKALIEEAVRALMEQHLDDPAAADLPVQIERASWQLGAERAEGLLRELRSKATSPAMKAGATFHLATLLAGESGQPSEAERRLRSGEARELLEEVRTQHADQPHPWLGTYGAAAESWIFQLERLQPGLVAPEIEGKDLQGRPMKLSDFRGKVVLLDFWGNW